MGGFFLSSGTLIFRRLARLGGPAVGGPAPGSAEVSLSEDGDRSCSGMMVISS
jgi:hypothetical protein